MNASFFVFLAAVIPQANVQAFTLPSATNQRLSFRTNFHNHDPYRTTYSPLFNAANPTDEEFETVMEKTKLSDEEIKKVGNLVADDEWMGLGMELSEIIRCAVLEEVKKNTAEFIGKDDYKIGDITKEIDNRVKVSWC
jgi:hypothetical protein